MSNQSQTPNPDSPEPNTNTQETTETKNNTDTTEHLDTLIDALDPTYSTAQLAQILYTQTEDSRSGRALEVVAAATLYLASKQNNDPISPDALADELSERYTRKNLLKMSKRIDRELGLGVQLFNPDTYIDNYCEKLNLTDETHALASKIVSTATEKGVASGRSPTGFAAAAVYYASRLTNDKRTQREVSDVADVSEVTIRNTYQDQAECISNEQDILLD